MGWTDTEPNVLLLLTDQERYDVSAPGGPDVRTPAMDRLQSEGMRFDRAYTPISICSSARASLLTGLYPHAHGMLNNCHEPDAVQPNLPPDLPTFGERLAEAGYDNSYIGKWHVGRDQTPSEFGFEYLGGGDGHHDSGDSAFRDHLRSHGVDPGEVELEDAVYTDEGQLIAATTPVPEAATRPHYLAERTIERIRGVDADAPFFHRADFVGPHHPYVVPEPYASMYDPSEVEPWPSFAETFDGKPRAHEQYLSYRGVEGFDWDRWADAVAKYFGFVTFIDHQMGRILDALDEAGLAESTAVVHTADHGDFTGGHRQFNKGPLMYEETYHVPLMVRWPGEVEPGSTCGEFVRLHDLMPTFLEIGGVEPPERLHARSLRPLLEGQVPPDWPDSVFAQYHGDEFGLYSQRMVRTNEYKLVYNSPDRNELYDLSRDPHELRNLIDHPEYRSVRADLAERLASWMRETDDVLATWVAESLDSSTSG
jgi:arylsulfatase A-like enzyme